MDGYSKNYAWWKKQGTKEHTILLIVYLYIGKTKLIYSAQRRSGVI